MDKHKKVMVFDTYEAMCRKIAEEICEDLQENPEQMLCIAAGNTSLGVFEELIHMYKAGKIDFSRASFVAMDEWLGMNEKTPGSCGNFLVKYFLNHVNYSPERVKLWDGTAEDTDRECRDAEAFIENGKNHRIDYLVLGCGMNGHLALNEPGTDFNTGAHVNELDEITKRVGQKYFEQEARLEGGITLGIGNFREAHRTVLMLNGKHKAEIAVRILEKESADIGIPATAVYDISNGSIYLDREAFGTGKS